MTQSGQGASRRTIAFIVLGVLLALVALAWIAESLLSQGGDVASIAIVRDGRAIDTLTVEDLSELPVRTFKQFGKVEEGPSVLEVLAAAGVSDFDSVAVVGLGVRDDGLLVLKRSQVTSDTVLDFANRGTMKIAGPEIAWDDRVRDITELRVE